MEKLLNRKLTEDELILKKYYTKHPERHLEKSHSYEDVKDVLSLINDDSAIDSSTIKQHVLEQSFIVDELDCAFVKHMRYLPPFLHQNEFFELLYVINGSCKAIISNEDFNLVAGDVCIFAPNTPHSVSAFSDDDFLINIIIRHSSFEKQFFGLLEGDDILSTFFKKAFYMSDEMQYIIFKTGNGQEFFNLVETTYIEYKSSNRFKRQMLNSLLSQLFVILFRKHEKDLIFPKVNMAGAHSNLIYILHYIQANYTTVSLHELSTLFNYSERQLQRIIEKATGKSFRELIQNQKMARSAELLTTTTLPISSICEIVGYPSENNFRRIFQKYYSISPKEYRKTNGILP